MIKRIKLISVLSLVFLMTLILAPFQMVAILLNAQSAGLLPVLWHRITCWLLRVRVNKIGVISANRPLLLISNHVSWLDIVVLGSISPVSFIAKREVAAMAGANLLAYLQRTIFIEREKKRGAPTQAKKISERLLDGDVIVLFAEGTTGNGNVLLPFKSALLGAAQYAAAASDGRTVEIQPVAIRYTHCNGLPLGRRGRAWASWPGEIELGPHLALILEKGCLDVSVVFGEPLVMDQHAKRSQVGHKSREQVRKMLAGLHA